MLIRNGTINFVHGSRIKHNSSISVQAWHPPGSVYAYQFKPLRLIFTFRSYLICYAYDSFFLKGLSYALLFEISSPVVLSHNFITVFIVLDRLELRDEYRLENRKAFANIWSDVVFGVSLFALIYFYQSQVSVFK